VSYPELHASKDQPYKQKSMVRFCRYHHTWKC